MINLEKESVFKALQSKLGIAGHSLEPVWEACEWSQCFKLLDSSAHAYYLKGNPRTWLEAEITNILHGYAPKLIPQVLSLDLLPEHEWRWFLMSAMGYSDYESLSFQHIQKTAFALGTIQRQAANDTQLSQLLQHCLPNQYLAIMEDLLAWIEQRYPDAPSELIARTRSHLAAHVHVFPELKQKLADCTVSCVHLDLWSGNIAVARNRIGLLDWGDALWGVGTASIINLLGNAELKANEDKVWQAYSRGLQRTISPEIIQLSQIPYLISLLLVERRLCQFVPDHSTLPVGIPPLLEELLKVLV